MLRLARICKHCRSHQGWTSGPGDPRQILIAMLVLVPILGTFLGAIWLAENKKALARNSPPSCRGQIKVTEFVHGFHSKKESDHLWVRAFISNESKTTVSDVILRVEADTKSGPVAEVFISEAYDSNIQAGDKKWVRVNGYMTGTPSEVEKVRVTVESATCRSGWR